MRRRVWGTHHNIKGSELTDVGLFVEEAVGGLGAGFSGARLDGLVLSVNGGNPAQLDVSPGWGVAMDAAVGRGRLAHLAVPAQVVFGGADPAGLYDIVATTVEVSLANDTVTPPPQNLPNGQPNPFYNPALTPYQLDTVRRRTFAFAKVPNPSDAPYSPNPNELWLGRVNWSGSGLTVTRRQVLFRQVVMEAEDPVSGELPITDTLHGAVRRILAALERITGKSYWRTAPKAPIEQLAWLLGDETIRGTWTLEKELLLYSGNPDPAKPGTIRLADASAGLRKNRLDGASGGIEAFGDWHFSGNVTFEQAGLGSMVVQGIALPYAIPANNFVSQRWVAVRVPAGKAIYVNRASWVGGGSSLQWEVRVREEDNNLLRLNLTQGYGDTNDVQFPGGRLVGRNRTASEAVLVLDVRLVNTDTGNAVTPASVAGFWLELSLGDSPGFVLGDTVV